MPSSPDRVPDLPGTRLLSSVGREGRKALDCLALNPDRAVLVIASHGVLYRFGGRPHASEPNRRWMEPLRRLRTVLRAICYLDSHDLAVLNAQGLPGLRPDEELRFDAVTEGGLAAYVNGDHQEWPVPDPPELREQVKQLLRRLELAESVQLIEVPPRCVRVHRVNRLGNDELWNLQGELRGAGEDEGSDVRAGPRLHRGRREAQRGDRRAQVPP